jgi:hypothetical protein
MRQVATLLLCGVALTAGAADVWRWKDASGVVHYSDFPRPGAERVSVNAAGSTGEAAVQGSSQTTTTASAKESPESSRSEQAEPRARPYIGCTVTQPANDEVFQGLQPVSVSLSIEPGLQNGHRVRVLYDGAPVAAWPANSTNSVLDEVYRGAHTLNVHVLDANGRALCIGPLITFHMRQPTVRGR